MRVKSILLQLLIVMMTLTSIPIYPASADNSSSQLFLVKFINPTLGIAKYEEKITQRYEYLPIVTVRLTEQERLLLEIDDNVSYIEEDYLVVASDVPPVSEIKPSATEPPKAMNFDTLNANTSSSDVRVAILDTGTWQGKELQIKDGVSFINEGKSYRDDHGHGSYIASILHHTAPYASIYALKVLNDQGIGTYSTVIKALEWSISNEMDIVNMSFGGKEYSLALAEAISLASDRGLMLVAAAGNDGQATLNYPARFNNVVAVGSVDHAHEKSTFSNTGNELDFVAVGEAIAGIGKNGEVVQGSGTSASVPQVSAIVALYMESFPSLHKDEIQELLRNTAIPLGAPEQYGYGLAQYLVGNEEEEDNELEEIIADEEIEEIEGMVNEEQKLVPLEDEGQREDLVLLGELRLQNERERMQTERLLTAERQQIEQEKAMLSVQDVAKEFQVDEEFIQDYLAMGYALQEIIVALRSQESGGSNRRSISSSNELKFPARREAVNISLDAVPEVISNIGDHIQSESGNSTLIEHEEQTQLWEGTPPMQEESSEIAQLNRTNEEEQPEAENFSPIEHEEQTQLWEGSPPNARGNFRNSTIKQD